MKRIEEIQMVDKNPRINEVSVQIVRAYESSGNTQFFLRAVRTDLKDLSIFNTDNILEYACHQTKHDLTIEECIDRAIFESRYLLKFFGLEKDDLKLVGFGPEELQIAETYTKRWRI